VRPRSPDFTPADLLTPRQHGANLTGDPFILLVLGGALDAAIAMLIVRRQIDRSSGTLGLP
jgi:hypothetical protein